MNNGENGKRLLNRSLEDLESILSTTMEASLGRLPVDNLPDVLDIGSLAVEIL